MTEERGNDGRVLFNSLSSNEQSDYWEVARNAILDAISNDKIAVSIDDLNAFFNAILYAIYKTVDVPWKDVESSMIYQLGYTRTLIEYDNGLADEP